jgi:hypothetical protein
MHLEDGHRVAELAAQATKEHEHHLPIPDGVAELGKGGGHRLETATVVGDVQGVFAEVAELHLEEERAGLLLAEELVLKVAPGPASKKLLIHVKTAQSVCTHAVADLIAAPAMW